MFFTARCLYVQGIREEKLHELIERHPDLYFGPCWHLHVTRTEG